MLRFVPKHQQDKQIPEAIAGLGVPAQLLSLLLDRGINTPEKIDKYLHPQKTDLYDPMLM